MDPIYLNRALKESSSAGVNITGSECGKCLVFNLGTDSGVAVHVRQEGAERHAELMKGDEAIAGKQLSLAEMDLVVQLGLKPDSYRR